MTTIREIFQTYAPRYVETYKDAIPKDHLKTINAIIKCRTSLSGVTVYKCTGCGEVHHVFKSCGNRHCPSCQHAKTIEWTNKQLNRQLPGHHFMMTFTVPQDIRSFIRSHQRICYSAMFKASSESIRTLASDAAYVGGDLAGFFGVLHTWGRQMQYHPHIHYVAAGGAFSTDHRKWHPSKPEFFLPVFALSKIYRAKFRDLMIHEGLYDQIPAKVWEMDWNVNCQPVGACESSIRYLSYYVFKVAISDHRIVSVEDGKVTIKYKKQKSSRTRHVTMDANEFIRRFLQHVLPKGFMKVRYYGFMNPNSSVSLEDIRARIELAYGFDIEKPEINVEHLPSIRCPFCGAEMKLIYSIYPGNIFVFLDTG